MPPLAVVIAVVQNVAMPLTRREWPVLIVNLIYIPAFAAMSLRGLNFEFLLYMGVVVAIAVIVLCKQRRIRFDLAILWGLTIWGMLHLAGGNLQVDGDVLYNRMLIDFVQAPYHILRYDQVVHVFGFAVATLVCHHLLLPYLRDGVTGQWTLSMLVVLMGSGFGAINEILEFVANVTVPETNVGGYENTAIDLVCNLIGGLLAVSWLAWRRRTSMPQA